MAQTDVETVTVATRITKPILRGIQTALTTNAHLNVADYVRDLIRKDLESRKMDIEKRAKLEAPAK